MWSTPRRLSELSADARTYSGRPLTPRLCGSSGSSTIPNFGPSMTWSRRPATARPIRSPWVWAPSRDRATDQLLVGVGPVHVAGVEQRHAELERAVDGGDRLVVVAAARVEG